MEGVHTSPSNRILNVTDKPKKPPSDSTTKARGLQHALENFHFLFVTTLLGEPLRLLIGLTAKLLRKKGARKGASERSI